MSFFQGAKGDRPIMLPAKNLASESEESIRKRSNGFPQCKIIRFSGSRDRLHESKSLRFDRLCLGNEYVENKY